MIQRLIGERSVIAMVISIILSVCLLFFFLPYGEPMSHWILPNSVHYPIISSLLSIATLLGVTFLYRELQVRKKLTAKRSYYQALLLSLLLLPIVSTISFVTVAAVGCYALGAMALISVHRIERASETIQRVGIATGVAILLCPPLVWGAIIITLMSIRLRHRSWRNGAVFILGCLFPFVLLTTFLLAMNWHEGIWGAFSSAISNVPESYDINFYAWIPALTMLAFTVIRPMGDDTQTSVIPIREMELLQTQWVWLVLFVILGLIGLVPFQVGMCLASIPASALITVSLEHSNKWWVPDLAIIILLSAILVR